MRIRIVEFADELKKKEFAKGEKVVALNICAQAFLKKNKIEFENSLNFFGLDGHQTVLKETKKIMNVLDQYINFSDKNKLSSSYNEGFNNYLFFYLRYILILLYIIQEIIKKYKPTEIVVPESTKIENFDYYCSPKDRLLAHLVSKYIKENNLKIKIIKEKKNNKLNFLNFSIFKKFLKKLVFSSSFFLFKYLFSKKNTYLVINDSNNFDNIIKQIKIEKSEMKPIFFSLSTKGLKKYILSILKGKVFNFFLIPDFTNYEDKKNIRNTLDNFTSQLLNNKDINYLNINLVNEINSFVSNTMYKAFVEFNSQVNFLSKIIKITNPKFMICQHTLLLGRAFGELAKIYNIPAMVVSHGTHVSHEQADIKYEWNRLADIMINKNFPYIAAQNPHMRKFLDDNNYKKNQIINTGPLLYNKINLSKKEVGDIKKKLFKSHADKKIILHAGTPKMRGSNRLYVYETVDEYIKNINKLISVFENEKNIFFAIKYRKNPRIMLQDFKELINETENCKVYSDESEFSDFLATSDVMISYSSTAIDEALYNKIPIILYDPDKKYSHISSAKNSKGNLNDSVFYCSDLKEINFTTQKIFQNKEELMKNDLFWEKHIFSNNKQENWLPYLI